MTLTNTDLVRSKSLIATSLLKIHPSSYFSLISITKAFVKFVRWGIFSIVWFEIINIQINKIHLLAFKHTPLITPI